MIKKKRLGTAALSGGQATLAVKPGSVLNKAITIIYSGANGFLSSSLVTPKLTSRSLAVIPHALLVKPHSHPAPGPLLVRAAPKGRRVNPRHR